MATFETSDGVTIRYERRGEGPVVFACHGGPNNICDTLIADLAPLEGTCTLVFHDYRGSGRSAAAPPETYTSERLADDLDELRQHLGYERVAVLAHSMGGFVALQFALGDRDACNRLALVATSPCGAAGPMVIPTLHRAWTSPYGEGHGARHPIPGAMELATPEHIAHRGDVRADVRHPGTSP